MKAPVGIVGAGLIGLATARQLAQSGVPVLVWEKEAAIARHQSGHNSGVAHAGIYYQPGSAKAKNCRRGVELLRPEVRDRVRHLIYPVPDPAYPFLGVHLTPRTDGEVDIGPNAVLALAREGYRRRDVSAGQLARLARSAAFRQLARQNWRAGLREMRGSLPVMLAAGNGGIVNISSVNAFLPDPGVLDSSAAKADVTIDGGLIPHLVARREAAAEGHGRGRSMMVWASSLCMVAVRTASRRPMSSSSVRRPCAKCSRRAATAASRSASLIRRSGPRAG